MYTSSINRYIIFIAAIGSTVISVIPSHLININTDELQYAKDSGYGVCVCIIVYADMFVALRENKKQKLGGK